MYKKIIFTVFFLLSVACVSWGAVTPVGSVVSPTHIVSVPSSKSVVSVSWVKPSGSVSAYSIVWDGRDATIPDDTPDISGEVTSVQSQTLYDGYVYFHIKVLGDDALWSETSHAGPFIIDKTPPEKAENFSYREEKGGSVTITWTTQNSDESFGTMLVMSPVNYPSTPNGGGSILFDENPSLGNTHVFTKTALETGRTYYFSVFTYDYVSDGPNFSNPLIYSIVVTGENSNGALQILRTVPQNDPADTIETSVVEDSVYNAPIEILLNQSVRFVSPAAISVTTMPAGASSGNATVVTGSTVLSGDNKIVFTPFVPFEPGDTGLRVNVLVNSGTEIISSVSGKTLDGNYNGVEDGAFSDSYSFHFFTRPAPSINAVSTQDGLIDTVLSINVTGSYFLPGSEVLIEGATVAFSISNVGAIESFDLTIVNPDGQTYTLQNAFSVELPAPTLSEFGVMAVVLLMSLVFFIKERGTNPTAI